MYMYVYLLLTEFEGHTVSYGLHFFLFNLDGLKRKKEVAITYSMDQENEVSKMFIIYLLEIESN